jgi:hypothetical protein
MEKGKMMRTIWMLLVAAPAAFLAVEAAAQGSQAIDGTWEGPWYRGMSSGVAKLHIAGDSGTLQLTNSETFGEEPRPLVKLVARGQEISLRADGSAGAPLTVELKLNEAGDKMKGMGKYEGFGVRLELQRTGR